ncbi:MAG: hypothetical protein CTY20_07925 [Hyphomicrobium sp.]|nr:MAG: hypothetical protein CTY20_07925 [Hyphomicrobium sp.]
MIISIAIPAYAAGAIPAEYLHDSNIVADLGDFAIEQGMIFRAPFCFRKGMVAPRAAICEATPTMEAPLVADWQAFRNQLRGWLLDATLSSYAPPDGEPAHVDALARYNAGEITFAEFGDVVGMSDTSYGCNRLLLPEGSGGAPPRVVPEPDPTPKALPPTDACDFDETELGKRAWIMEPLVHRKLMTLLVATGGSGKSTFAQQIGVAVALGLDFGPFKARGACNVMILNREDDEDEQRKRLIAAFLSMGVDRADLAGRLFYWNPTAAPLVMATQEGKLRGVSEHKWGRDLRKEMIAKRIGLVIMDPLVKFHAGLDENSNTDQEQIARAALSIAADTGAAVLVCHHAHKHSVPSLAASRGGSALPDAARLGFYMAKSEKEPVTTLHHLKNTMGSVVPPTAWRFAAYTLASGEEAAALEPMAVEPMTWAHKAAVLDLVAQGRGGDDGPWLPWASSPNADRELRLDVAVAARWGLTEKAAREVLEAYAAAGLIESRMVPVRKPGGRKATMQAWLLAEPGVADGKDEPSGGEGR